MRMPQIEEGLTRICGEVHGGSAPMNGLKGSRPVKRRLPATLAWADVGSTWLGILPLPILPN